LVDQDKVEELLRQFTRLELMEIDTCSHCALCTEKCPAYHVSGNPLHAPGVRLSRVSRMVAKKLGLRARILGGGEVSEEDVRDLSESAFHCTLCGRCMESCPFGFDTHGLWVKIRSLVRELGGLPENLVRLDGLLGETMNPYGLEPDTRLDWSLFADMDEVPEMEEAEVAYFVGCTTAYKSANHNVAVAIASLLEAQGESWTVLGEEEWCCGAPSAMSGNLEEAKRFAQHNVEALNSLGVKRVVTGCAGCYRMLRFEYPALLGGDPGFTVEHITQYLARLLGEGRLELERGSERVIYHDPCELGRLGGVVEEPRAVLRALTGELLEFEEHGVDSKCCGGGGLLQSVDGEMRLKVVRERLEEAVEKGAEILVSSCPACKLAFTDGVREFGFELEVLNLSELVARRLGVLG